MTPNVATGTNPECIVFHPSLSVCYVPCYGDPYASPSPIGGEIRVYTAASGTGVLAESTALKVSLGTGVGPISMACTRNGKYAYVANWDGSSVTAYSISASTGALTAIGTVKPGTGTMLNPDSICIENSDKYVYVCSDGTSNVCVFSIGGTGALTFVASTACGSNPTRIVTDPSDKFVYTANRVSNDISIFSIAAATGKLTAVGTVNCQFSPQAMAISGGSSGVAYAPVYAYCSNQNDNTLSVYTVATSGASAGKLTATSFSPVSSGGNMPLTVLVHPNQKWLYVLDRNDAGAAGKTGLQAFSVDATTGKLTAIGGLIGTDSGPRRMCMEPQGKFLYVAHDTAKTVGCYSIDQATGALTRLAGSAGTVSLTYNIWGIATDSTGLYVLLPDVDTGTTSSFTIDPVGGGLTLASTSASGGTSPYTVTNSQNGKYVYQSNYANSPNVEIYTFSSATGAFTSLGTADAGASGGIQFATDPTGAFLYLANFTASNCTSWTMSPSAGTLSAKTNNGTGNNPQGVTVDPSGKYVYVPNSGDNTISQFSIGTGGALTSLGTVACGTRPHTVAIVGTIK